MLTGAGSSAQKSTFSPKPQESANKDPAQKNETPNTKNRLSIKKI